VELGECSALFGSPQHPYTQALLGAVPVPDPKTGRKRIILSGDVPSPINPPAGCHFHTRCPYATDRCRAEAPVLRTVANGSQVACHLAS
jgi:oligopeptide transport system ATP-binding protein